MSHTLEIILGAAGILMAGAAFYAVIHWAATQGEIARRRAAPRPKMSDFRVGQLVLVLTRPELGPFVVMSRLLTSDSVTLDAPVDGVQTWDSDMLRGLDLTPLGLSVDARVNAEILFSYCSKTLRDRCAVVGEFVATENAKVKVLQ